MRRQILLLALLPIFTFAGIAAVRAVYRISAYEHREWASHVVAQAPYAAAMARQAASPEALHRVLEDLAGMGLPAEIEAPPRPGAVDMRLGSLDRDGFRRLVDRLEALSALPQGDEAVLALRIDDARGLVLHPTRGGFLNKTQAIAEAFALVSLSIAPQLLLAVFMSWRLTRPLVDFAAAAQRISLEERSREPFRAEGALEIRSLAASLNTMQARLGRMADERTRLIWGLAHDLRTPLTRLRMRAERSREDGLRDAMLNDVDKLAGMIDDCMLYLRNASAVDVPMRKVDLASMLQTVVSDYADMSRSVSYDGPSRLVATCQPNEIVRAVSNLIDNALRYSEEVEVTLRAGPDGQVSLSVADRGPGIPDELKSQAMEPFFKADSARQLSDGGGAGLGLANAVGIARLHGGRLSLHDRSPHGLIARLTLPASARRAQEET